MDNYKEKSKYFFDKIANKKYGNSEKIDKHILKHIKDKKQIAILDIGCGTGRLLKKIYSLNNMIQGTGIDISEKTINIANKNKMGNLKFLIEDTEALPFENNSFDYVICINSFHHYPNPKQVLSEVKRVLKSNGEILLGEIWIPFGIKTIINMYLNIINKYLIFLSKGDYKIYSKKDLIKLFLKSGFEMKSFQLTSYVLSFSRYKKSRFAPSVNQKLSSSY